MRQADPRIPLNCPKCGHALRYGASTASGRPVPEGSDIFQPDADVHHYVCTNGPCGRFWKFSPEQNVVEDALQVAALHKQEH